jgi:hypothetical protein
MMMTEVVRWAVKEGDPPAHPATGIVIVGALVYDAPGLVILIPKTLWLSTDQLPVAVTGAEPPPEKPTVPLCDMVQPEVPVDVM